MRSQPVVGFQTSSVHSMVVIGVPFVGGVARGGGCNRVSHGGQGERGQAACGPLGVFLVRLDTDRPPTGLAGGVEGAAGSGERVDDETALGAGVADQRIEDPERLLRRVDRKSTEILDTENAGG